jgi:flagellar M-ring protein FliF
VVPVSEPAGLLGMFQFTKDDLMYGIELAVMLLLGFVVLFMVIRPLVKRILASEPIAAITSAAMPALADASAQGVNTGQNLIPGTNATAQMIDVAQVQGQVHAQSVHRVGELAQQNPSETAAIVRQWLSEPA